MTGSKSSEVVICMVVDVFDVRYKRDGLLSLLILFHMIITIYSSIDEPLNSIKEIKKK